jgi:tRNA (guanine6-N2)-methyltransferase
MPRSVIRRRPPTTRGGGEAVGPTTAYELECLPGLEPTVREELHERLASRVTVVAQPQAGRLQIGLRGPARLLSSLRSVLAAHLLLAFPVPRPKALLGHEHFTRLVAAIEGEIVAPARDGFASMRLSAAGSDSSVMQRFQAELSQALHLEGGGEQADLLVSMRRPAGGASGWEVLVRTTPRPLAARAWRVCNMPGALNATAAYAMARMVATGRPQTLVNLACGSGTLLVEYLGYHPALAAVGIDVSDEALRCARANLSAAGKAGEALLARGDVAALPLPARSVDAFLVDLPYGMLVGSAEANERLYPVVLREAARVAAMGARLAAITTNRTAFERALTECRGEWRQQEGVTLTVPFKSGYIHPTIYRLTRVRQ